MFMLDEDASISGIAPVAPAAARPLNKSFPSTAFGDDAAPEDVSEDDEILLEL